MSAYLSVLIRDHGDEYSNMRIPIQTQGGTVTITDITSFGTSLAAALANISLGTLVKVTFSQDLANNADVAASNPFAQRELGARFFFVDDTDYKKGYITIPCPDLTNLDLNADGDTFDVTDTEIAAMVTWVEANVQITSGQSVTVDRVVLVGRNS